jgi:hypothetical protein
VLEDSFVSHGGQDCTRWSNRFHVCIVKNRSFRISYLPSGFTRFSWIHVVGFDMSGRWSVSEGLCLGFCPRAKTRWLGIQIGLNGARGR